MEESDTNSSLNHKLIRLSKSIQENLSNTQYIPPESSNVSIKSMLESLLPQEDSSSTLQMNHEVTRIRVREFSLCCSALASAEIGTSSVISWVPKHLSLAAKLAFKELSEAVFNNLDESFSRRNGAIKESAIDSADDEVSAASAKVPVVHAILAAYQLRWFIAQVSFPYLGKLCALVIPCALTALDHWSPDVKGQAMISFIHLAKNVNAAELGGYEDVILDACCQNIASSDELWQLVVEMSVLFITCTQQGNPRSPWYEKMLSQMLSHLERQPKNAERSIAWLQLIGPVFNALGLVLLVHFRRIFPLFFLWMHADDDKTILLVLERVYEIMKLTWVRNTPYTERLVDELVALFKESAVRKGREEIRSCIYPIFLLLKQCKGQQFEIAWSKHKDDPNLSSLVSSFIKHDVASAMQ